MWVLHGVLLGHGTHRCPGSTLTLGAEEGGHVRATQGCRPPMTHAHPSTCGSCPPGPWMQQCATDHSSRRGPWPSPRSPVSRSSQWEVHGCRHPLQANLQAASVAQATRLALQPPWCGRLKQAERTAPSGLRCGSMQKIQLCRVVGNLQHCLCMPHSFHNTALHSCLRLSRHVVRTCAEP